MSGAARKPAHPEAPATAANLKDAQVSRNLGEPADRQHQHAHIRKRNPTPFLPPRDDDQRVSAADRGLNSPARRSFELVAHGGGSTCAARSSSKVRSIGARLRADAEVPAQPRTWRLAPRRRPRRHDVSRWGNPYEKGRGHWRDNPTEIARSCWDGGASTTPSMQVGGGHLAEPETA
ncbi:MAG: hypothetical protein QOJ50_2113 [Cryptosporangiaceae bacterium]|nr:hypothetical protein [Cryptosporangiaceae bacterium]